MIAAQQRERLPALRAAVPAPREIPDHLEPGQVRVIPPPRPRPRAALLPRRRSRGPGPPAPPARRHRPAAPGATSPTTGRTPSAAVPPGQPAASSSSAACAAFSSAAARSPRRPLAGAVSAASQLPVRLQRRSQRIPQGRLSILRIRDNASRNRHAAQQTPSAAANHAPRASVSQRAALIAPTPRHTTSEYLRFGSHAGAGVFAAGLSG